ncbi:MAG: YggS family pyridoxal phosphate-dependent enzyme [Myxococcales bacterium]|nr:YggS family pyridoxal phosphate-dependent enzyme [Myxococcales bacterium]
MTEASRQVARNLERVQERIAAACECAGRAPGEVRLIAVSKRHAPAAIEAAYEAGQREFGENYVQELSDKASRLVHLAGLRWRLIGHLQRNKTRRVAEIAYAVDTVDSARLAQALERQAAGGGRRLRVLLQVNIGREPQKAGVAPEGVAALVATVRGLPHLELQGLLAVPPVSRDPETSRPHFAALRALARRHSLSELSMGMSADLEVAVEEGATMVRVGSAIFGPRDR